MKSSILFVTMVSFASAATATCVCQYEDSHLQEAGRGRPDLCHSL